MRSNKIEDIINNHINQTTNTNIANSAEELKLKFNALWNSDWKKYVDGKAYMGKLCARLAKECSGIETARIKDIITKKVKANPNEYAFGKFYRSIIDKFSAQGSF